MVNAERRKFLANAAGLAGLCLVPRVAGAMKISDGGFCENCALYTTIEGDTWWDLTEYFYGDPNKWEELHNYENNKERFPDPKNLPVGVDIKVDYPRALRYFNSQFMRDKTIIIGEGI